MKIVELECVLLTSPYYEKDFLRSYGVVRIKTDDGRIGFGEPYAAVNMPTVCREAVRALRPLFMGQPVEPIESLMQNAHLTCEYFDHRGMIYCLLGAIDWALHDLAAQRAGVPLHRLLNSNSADSVALYASTGSLKWSVAQEVEHIEQRIAEGFRIAKVRVGCCGQTVDEAIRRAQQVAAGLGGRIALGIDSGQQIFYVGRCWSLREATKLAEAVGEFGAVFFEDPLLIHDFDGYCALKKLNKVSIAGGEMFAETTEFERYINGGAIDLAQPDASVVAGPKACLRIGECARKRGVRVGMHAWAGPVGQMQNIHAALAIGDCAFVEFCTYHYPMLREVLTPVWRFERGQILATKEPGLGVTISSDVERRFAFQENAQSLIA